MAEDDLAPAIRAKARAEAITECIAGTENQADKMYREWSVLISAISAMKKLRDACDA